jgi:hypothetical protein
MQQQMIDLDDPRDAPGMRGPAAYPREDHHEDTKYATYSRSLLEEQRAAMEPLFQTWTQNLLFLAGLQWWSYDRMTSAFLPPRGPKWKERPVRNILVPYFKHVMAKATKNRTATTCVPASSDPEDLHSGQLGDDVLRGKWQELRLWKIIRRAMAWTIPTGNAWIMPYWNTDSGLIEPLTTLVEAERYDSETGMLAGMDMIEVPCDENGDPLLDEMGHYDTEAAPAYIDVGEVGVKVFSGFQVFMDPGLVNEEEATFVLIAEPTLLRDVHRRWPEATDVVAEDVSDFDRFGSFVSGLAAGADTHMAGGHVGKDTEQQKSLVLHYYQRPSVEYPQGRHWVTAGLTVLERPGPLPDGIWPVVVPLKEMDVPGQPHGDAPMTAVVGLQREYNEVNAQIKEHHNLLLRGKWLVPLGSNIRRGQITSEPGEVLQYTPGLKPEMADLRPLPQKVYDEREKILEDFQLISGLHKVSMGTPPPGVTSGRAFLTLQEADDSDFGPLMESIDNAVAQLGWLILQLIQRYYEEERLVRVSGENNRYRVRAFKGSDLNGVVDVVAQAGSSFPWSAVAKQSMMIELAQTVPALFIDPETGMFDQERFRRLLPIGGAEAVGLGAELDVAEALREEEQFEDWDGINPLPTIMPYQNHQTHLRQHARVLKSATFAKWAPEAKEAFLAHWMETAQLIEAMQMAALNAQLQAEASAAGGPPPKGGGGGGVGRGNGRPHDRLTDAELDPVSG